MGKKKLANGANTDLNTALVGDVESKHEAFYAKEDEKYTVELKTVTMLVDVSIFWPISFTMVSLFIFLSCRHNSGDLVLGHRSIPTLSEIGGQVPESYLFTYGLHFEAVLLALLFSVIYIHFGKKIVQVEKSNQVQEKVELTVSSNLFNQISSISEYIRANNIKYLNFCNNMLLTFGLLCAVFVSLAGSVPYHVNPDVNVLFVYMMFVFFVAHMVLYYFTLSNSIKPSSQQKYLHRFCLFICFPFNLFWLSLDLILGNECEAADGSCFTAEVDFIPLMKFATVFAFGVYIYMFREELADMKLRLDGVVPGDPTKTLFVRKLSYQSPLYSAGPASYQSPLYSAGEDVDQPDNNRIGNSN